jgi:hypothetical protein
MFHQCVSVFFADEDEVDDNQACKNCATERHDKLEVAAQNFD